MESQKCISLITAQHLSYLAVFEIYTRKYSTFCLYSPHLSALQKSWDCLRFVCAFEQQVRCEWIFGLFNACHLGFSCLHLTAHYRIPTAKSLWLAAE